MADEGYVRKGLAPYEVKLRHVCDSAQADWVASTGHSQYIYLRTKQNARFDHVARHAYREFGEDKNVRIIAVMRPSSSCSAMERSFCGSNTKARTALA